MEELIRISNRILSVYPVFCTRSDLQLRVCRVARAKNINELIAMRKKFFFSFTVCKSLKWQTIFYVLNSFYNYYANIINTLPRQ